LFALARGFTVILNSFDSPVHADIDAIFGVTVTVTVIGLAVLLIAAPNEIVVPLPADKPAPVLSTVHENVTSPAGVPLKDMEESVSP
jgi:hypothetical protein